MGVYSSVKVQIRRLKHLQNTKTLHNSQLLFWLCIVVGSLNWMTKAVFFFLLFFSVFWFCCGAVARPSGMERWKEEEKLPCVLHVWDVKANHSTCCLFHPPQQNLWPSDSDNKMKLMVPAGLFDTSIDKHAGNTTHWLTLYHLYLWTVWHFRFGEDSKSIYSKIWHHK